MKKYYELLEAAGKKSSTFPATDPPTWYIQGDREALYSMYNGNPVSGNGRSEGGFYPNLDNQYIRTILNLKHGRVFVLRGKAPTTPKTVNGDARQRGGRPLSQAQAIDRWLQADFTLGVAGAARLTGSERYPGAALFGG